jgi:Holliday junction resolvase-like predicted endonuclease
MVHCPNQPAEQTAMDVESYLETERMSKLGRLGEQLAAECLLRAGFTAVRNLNQGTNFRYADIVASSADERFLIGVKARNEYQASGKINPCYNAVLIATDKKRMLEQRGMTEAEITALLWLGVDTIAAKENATPAWIAVAIRPEQGSYSAYFGARVFNSTPKVDPDEDS